MSTKTAILISIILHAAGMGALLVLDFEPAAAPALAGSPGGGGVTVGIHSPAGDALAPERETALPEGSLEPPVEPVVASGPHPGPLPLPDPPRGEEPAPIPAVPPVPPPPAPAPPAAAPLAAPAPAGAAILASAPPETPAASPAAGTVSAAPFPLGGSPALDVEVLPAPPESPAASPPAPPAPPGSGEDEPGAGGAAGVDAPMLDDPGLLRPVYPTSCRRLGHQGVAVVRVRVEADGRPSRVELMASAGCTDLDRSALEAASGARFRPARRLGRSVASTVEQPFRFRLRE